MCDVQARTGSEYKMFAARLDKGQVDYPEEFAVKALLFVTDNLLAARKLCFRRAADMYSIPHFDKATQSQEPVFKALAPNLRSILPLSTKSMEKALVQGLFRSVLLSYMTQPDRCEEAYFIAHTLRTACDAAASRDLAASEADISGGQSTIACQCQAWIFDMQDAASAIIFLYSGRESHRGEASALHHVRHATTGSLLLLAGSIENEPWATMARDLHDQSELLIVPEITESLRACALHPAVWARAAARIPGWKIRVRPGITQQLEEKLWTVFLADWKRLNTDDVPGCRLLLEHLRLARRLTAPSKPTDAELDAMQELAPRPQLCIIIQA